jgi:hypothetical protein
VTRYILAKIEYRYRSWYSTMRNVKNMITQCEKQKSKQTNISRIISPLPSLRHLS